MRYRYTGLVCGCTDTTIKVDTSLKHRRPTQACQIACKAWARRRNVSREVFRDDGYDTILVSEVRAVNVLMLQQVSCLMFAVLCGARLALVRVRFALILCGPMLTSAPSPMCGFCWRGTRFILCVRRNVRGVILHIDVETS